MCNNELELGATKEDVCQNKYWSPYLTEYKENTTFENFKFDVIRTYTRTQEAVKIIIR